MSLQGSTPWSLLTVKESLPASIVAFWCGIVGSILYQPPVGIVTWWVTTQWLQRLLFPNNPLTLLDHPFTTLTLKNKRPKSTELDTLDRDYNVLGGVQSQALRQLTPAESQWMETASLLPQATRWQCAQQSIEALLQAFHPNNSPYLATVLEVRALDSLLRWIRDEELLPSTEQLSNRKESCENQLNSFNSFQQALQRAVQSNVQRMLKRPNRPLSLEDCRIHYQDTSKQLQNKYEQLGRLQEMLMQQPQQPDDRQQHLEACANWNRQAKLLLKDLLQPHTMMHPKDLSFMSTTSWSSTEWTSVLELLNNYETFRNQPSSRLERLSQKYRTRIPSALWKIALAKAVHHAVLPYWPWMKTTGHQVVAAVWGIVEFRFYKPLKVIVMDLLNRRPHLLDPAQLTDEQTSLQNMLRDLGIAVDDLDHAEALAQASRLYEQELQRGAVKNMLFGNMVRLLLIQVQQLKAELLRAFQSIDELVDANRLNVSLLAAIPAFLLVRLGSRTLYALLYRLRVRDLTGLKDAHTELTHRLQTLERILILAEDGQLQGAPLGEFISHDQKYLLMLDYCQPPFIAKQVDSIYKDMQDLLPPGGLDRETQVNLLKLIQQKNADLIKSL